MVGASLGGKGLAANCTLIRNIHNKMSSSRRIAYFYDPDVGSFHYGEKRDGGGNVLFFFRCWSSNEASQAGTHTHSCIELWVVQENGGNV